MPRESEIHVAVDDEQSDTRSVVRALYAPDAPRAKAIDVRAHRAAREADRRAAERSRNQAHAGGVSASLAEFIDRTEQLLAVLRRSNAESLSQARDQKQSIGELVDAYHRHVATAKARFR